MTEPKRYVTCEYHHPSCLPGWGHFETESCINPMVAVIPPKFQQFADSGATEFPIRDRFPTKDDGPGGAIRLAPPDELRKREILDEIEMAKRFARPGLYHGENPRAEVMAWMDYADALEADLRSATASYRKALDAKKLLETADQLRWETWSEAIGDAAVGLMDKMQAFIDSDAMASAIYKFGRNSANGNDHTDWDKVDRSSLERLREWYNDSQAQLRNAQDIIAALEKTLNEFPNPLNYQAGYDAAKAEMAITGPCNCREWCADADDEVGTCKRLPERR